MTTLQRRAFTNNRYGSDSRYSGRSSWNRSNAASKPKQPFQEIAGAAFFIGKLNKNHDREVVYNALRKLTVELDFYIRKLDMPYACVKTRRGNCGYAFVHTNSREEAERIVSMGTINLGKQVCDVKAYAGRSGSSVASSGYNTPRQPVSSFVNPLKDRSEEEEPTVVQQKENNNPWSRSGNVINIIKCDGLNNDKLAMEEDQSSTSDLSTSSEHASFDANCNNAATQPAALCDMTSFNAAELRVLQAAETAKQNGMGEEEFAMLYQQWYEYLMNVLATVPDETVNQVYTTLNN